RRSAHAVVLLAIAGLCLLLGAVSARADTRTSNAVGVIPGPLKGGAGTCGGFAAPIYHPEDGLGLPKLLTAWFATTPGDCGTVAHAFAGVGTIDASGTSPRIVGVTPAALAGLDTLVLYGVRWDSLDAGEHAAINAFAATRKVIIWDADSTT